MVNCYIKLFQLTGVFFLSFAFHYDSSAQIPPPGYERAKKMQEERMKMSALDRDSVAVIDTVIVFDPSTYESETTIVNSKLSLREYCTRYLGMSNADILLDGQPHVVIDPRTYDEIIVRLTPEGKIVTGPK